ncbi:MAG: proline--tRNA ligase [Oscillospiraceae bacterium]
MAQDKKQVTAITPRDKDFAQWFTDVVIKAELIDYSSVKGMFILRPYGYAIWENIMHQQDARYKELGHENVAMPMLIPESLLTKEKEHVEGFAPECAWVTFGGSDPLEERLAIRPTSETLFCDHWARTVHSWRDLPKLYNQWVSVLRWEKTSRPFLRHREFYWQEGHTIHATPEEAIHETEQMLEVYADLCENWLAMPVVRGRKTDKEKFAGAERTYTLECMMHDKKALQSGTSHYFGNGFAEKFDITFTNKNNEQEHPYQTSWGISTRLIGGIIMVHGDDNGLVMPPRIAPVQAVVIPVASHKEGVTEASRALLERLKKMGVRAKIDESDNSFGWKAAQYEMLGYPLRVELGPKDIEKGQCCIARRDTGEKEFVALDQLEARVPALLDEIHQNMYDVAAKRLEENTFYADTWQEVEEIMEEKGGFVITKWCGEEECELDMKDLAGVSSRCIPFKQRGTEGKCAVCGKPCTTDIMWGVAY